VNCSSPQPFIPLGLHVGVGYGDAGGDAGGVLCGGVQERCASVYQHICGLQHWCMLQGREPAAEAHIRKVLLAHVAREVQQDSARCRRFDTMRLRVLHFDELKEK
jgi:hypothetical protein